METTDQKTIVKRIARAWKVYKNNVENAPNDFENEPFRKIEREKMLSYRYALESTGLTLNEIIALGDADNLDEAIDELFVKNGQKT